MKIISSMMFTSDEQIIAVRGVLESPIDWRIVISRLFITVTTIPNKITAKYLYESSKISSGVFKNVSILLSKETHTTVKAIPNVILSFLAALMYAFSIAISFFPKLWAKVMPNPLVIPTTNPSIRKLSVPVAPTAASA